MMVFKIIIVSAISVQYFDCTARVGGPLSHNKYIDISLDQSTGCAVCDPGSEACLEEMHALVNKRKGLSIFCHCTARQ